MSGQAGRSAGAGGAAADICNAETADQTQLAKGICRDQVCHQETDAEATWGSDALAVVEQVAALGGGDL